MNTQNNTTRIEIPENWGMYMQRIDEKPSVTRVNLALYDSAPYSGYQYRIQLAVYYKNQTESGLPTAEENPQLWEIEDAFVELLKQDGYPLPNLTEEQVSADFLNSIDSVSQNPIPVIYQSGYLTIRSYDEEFQLYRLGFPNQEVEEGFMRYLLPFYTHVTAGESVFSIAKFVQDVRQGRPEQFMQRMETMFADTDYKIVGDSELYFQNVFYLVMKMMGFYTKVERPTSGGRMDMVIETPDYVYILEFKLDGTPQQALQQIETRGYARPFAMDKRRVFRIGVNFSKQKRCIDGWEIAG